MAQYSYENYSAQSKARSGATGERKSTRFIGEFLKESGSTVIVRFPYHSMADVMVETTHSVRFPGDKYDKRVRCPGDNCPLCASKVKLDTRVFVKAVVYEVENNQVKLIPAIWDRGAAFADIDLKNLVQEYGDLTKTLFKIKRTGTGLDTRYDILPVINNVVYNPEVYKADFSCLEGVDPAKVLTKSIDQYFAAIDGTQAEQDVATGQQAQLEVEQTPVSTVATNDVQQTSMQTNVERTPVASNQQTDQPKQEDSASKPHRYQFF